jgi:hypothetical protein
MKSHVDFAYARLNQLSVDRQHNYVSASFIGDEAVELTRDASRLFQDLGMVEIAFISRDVVREAI